MALVVTYAVKVGVGVSSGLSVLSALSAAPSFK
jgi:hypothetical protein